MLVDDNPDDLFFHERVIRKNDAANTVISKQGGVEALEYLKAKKEHPTTHPDLIFLDINMLGMNGWEFLEEYGMLDAEYQCKITIVMLTTSDNPDDKKRALSKTPKIDFRTKPLTKEMLSDVMVNYFSENN